MERERIIHTHDYGEKERGKEKIIHLIRERERGSKTGQRLSNFHSFHLLQCVRTHKLQKMWIN